MDAIGNKVFRWVQFSKNTKYQEGDLFVNPLRFLLMVNLNVRHILWDDL